jgi:hypothetical protein
LLFADVRGSTKLGEQMKPAEFSHLMGRFFSASSHVLLYTDAWVDWLDALTASPEHHTLLFENERVRVLNTTIPAGEQTAIHTHCWQSAMYILSWSDFVRYDDQGQVLVDSRKIAAFKNPPAVLWSDALPPHSLENVGQADLNIISVELKENPG